MTSYKHVTQYKYTLTLTLTRGEAFVQQFELHRLMMNKKSYDTKLGPCRSLDSEQRRVIMSLPFIPPPIPQFSVFVTSLYFSHRSAIGDPRLIEDLQSTAFPSKKKKKKRKEQRCVLPLVTKKNMFKDPQNKD